MLPGSERLRTIRRGGKALTLNLALAPALALALVPALALALPLPLPLTLTLTPKGFAKLLEGTGLYAVASLTPKTVALTP